MPRWFITLTLVLSLVVAPAAAQAITQSWTDDFENGNVDGWEEYGGGEYETYPQVSSESVEGEYSLYAESISDFSVEPEANWTSGPALNTSKPFTVEATIRPNNINEEETLWVGIVGEDSETPGLNAMIVFDHTSNSTYLNNYGFSDPPANSSNYIPGTFNNEWTKLKIRSYGNGTLVAKVWQYGTTEPDDYQLEETFNGSEGYFSIGVGNNQNEAWLDSVTIEGTEPTNPRLSIDAENYQKHGTTQPYRVLWEENTTGIANETTDVTENATVESLNTDVITVDEANQELVATNDTAVAERVLIRAEYNGSVTYQNVTVATADVENLEVLPPLWRFSASIGSPTIQAILVAVFMGVFATRMATAFAGLGMMQLVMVGGWFTGYVSVGMAMVSLFVALFIGLNMAANIDYTVRR